MSARTSFRVTASSGEPAFEAIDKPAPIIVPANAPGTPPALPKVVAPLAIEVNAAPEPLPKKSVKPKNPSPLPALTG